MPEQVTPGLLDELRRITPYDPEHLPLEIELIEAFRQRHPELPQVACFDTAFHRTLPQRFLFVPQWLEGESFVCEVGIELGCSKIPSSFV